MIDYNVDTLIFGNGERYPILMGSDEILHFYMTLWITVKIRPDGKQAKTISNKLEHVKWFLQWEVENQRNLYLEFQQGKYLDEDDIQSIKSHIALVLNNRISPMTFTTCWNKSHSNVMVINTAKIHG